MEIDIDALGALIEEYGEVNYQLAIAYERGTQKRVDEILQKRESIVDRLLSEHGLVVHPRW